MITHQTTQLEQSILDALATSKNNFSTLFLNLVEQSNVSMLKEILKSKLFSHHITKKLLQTCFTEACSRGDLDVVQYLIKTNKIDVNAGNDAAFVWACSMNRENVIKYLLEKEHVDISTNSHYVFRAASRSSNPAMLDYLLFSPKLKYHSDPFAKENNAFIMACSNTNVDTVLYFIENKALHGLFNRKTVNDALQNAILNCSKSSSDNQINDTISIVNSINNVCSNIMYDNPKLLSYAFHTEQEQLINQVLNIEQVKKYFIYEDGSKHILNEIIKSGNIQKFASLLKNSVVNLLPEKEDFLLYVVQAAANAAIKNYDMKFVEYMAEKCHLKLTDSIKEYLQNLNHPDISKYFLYGALKNETNKDTDKNSNQDNMISHKNSKMKL